MNNEMRTRLADLASDLREVETKATAIASALADLANEEREKYDNLSEGLQQSERGQAFETNADTLESAQSTVETLASDAGSAADELEGID